MKRKHNMILNLVGLMCVLAFSNFAQAQTSVFTYQGRLTDSSMAASGTYDFQFALFDAATGGTQSGTTQTVSGVSVSNGVFTVQLDFGSMGFPGADRFLEISVKKPSDSSYTTLSPRQQITSAPYAIRSLNATNADNAANATNAANADTLDGIDSSGFAQTGQVVRSLNNLSGDVTLQAGSNVTITPSGSTLTIAASGGGGGSGLTWQEVTGAAIQAQSNRGYIANNASSQVNITLPASPAVGDIVRVAGAGGAGWRVSQNAGQTIAGASLGSLDTWTPRLTDANRQWSGVASSADGTKLIAADRGGRLYTSTDSGVSWTARESNRNWDAVASSADGTKLVAVVENGQIYTSTDSGVTWTARQSNRSWNGVASSADGTKLVAVVFDGQIYTSTDSGVTWTARQSNRSWNGVASSADGTKLVAVALNGQIYTSTDSGVTWTARQSNRSWTGVASSADGTKLVAVVGGGSLGGQIYTSTDSGVSWTARESNRDWGAVASSADGTKLVAVDRISASGVGGRIYTSTDSGVSWTARESVRDWTGVASSADGNKLVAVAGGGFIYTTFGGPSSGAAGFLTGGADAAVELLYTGSGRFLIISSEGALSAF